LSEGYCAHLALEVEDFGEARRQAEERGASIVGAPRDRGDGVLQMYLADPDGYVVELMAAGHDRAGEVTTQAGISGESA
jgi:predicted enzyme related to lactoylglutathione lyase